MDKITEYILEQTKQLLAIDSPTGYTKEASDYLMQEYSSLGYQPDVPALCRLLTGRFHWPAKGQADICHFLSPAEVRFHGQEIPAEILLPHLR